MANFVLIGAGIVLIFIAVIGLTPAYADQTYQISLQLDKTSYGEGETGIMTGTITSNQVIPKGELASFVMESPNGNVVALHQFSLDYGTYKDNIEFNFPTGGSLMKTEGTYTITVKMDNAEQQIAFYFGGNTVIPTEIPEACVGCTMEEAKEAANQYVDKSNQVSVWTDKTDYGHSEIILVSGKVVEVDSKLMTVTVISPLNSIVTIDQVGVSGNGSFETTFNTAGAMWKYDGTYTIRADYSSPEKSDSVKIELSGGVVYSPNYQTPTLPTKQEESVEIETVEDGWTSVDDLPVIDEEDDPDVTISRLQDEVRDLKLENRELKLKIEDLRNIVLEQIRVIMKWFS